MEMLVTQALDERDLLAKKIKDAIRTTTFISAKKTGKQIDYNNAPVDKVTSDIQSTYQSIQDMIKRYTMIVQKITESNATTIINVDGKEMTVSAAIAIIKDINTQNFFDTILLDKLTKDYNSLTNFVERNNNTVDNNKLSMLNALISRNDSKKASDEEIQVVDKTFEKDYYEFIDPLGITDKIKELRDYTTTIKQKILSAIKISNATTIINID